MFSKRNSRKCYIKMSTITSIELLIFGYIRKEIESNNLFKLIIPKGIKLICSKYYGYYFIDTQILSLSDCINLYELLSKQIEFKQCELIYNGLSDGFDIKSFYKKCDNVSPSILIIESNWGNIFGAFTTIKWQDGTKSGSDTNAFIFLFL